MRPAIEREIELRPRRLVAAALLCFTLAACAAEAELPAAQGTPSASAADRTDRSPHREGFVTANGVRLHYLDWAGSGEVLLLLSGLGNSAHIFDDLAPEFTDRFRVVGLTRRGHGRSEQPESGYGNDTLVEDVRAFLDALGIERVSIMGHSMAGNEMTRFAERFPERVGKLVYLDAAYDHSEVPLHGESPEAHGEHHEHTPPPPAAQREDPWDALRNELGAMFGFWSEALEADMRATSTQLPDGSVRAVIPSATVGRELLTGSAAARPNFRAVRAPALALYSMVEGGAGDPMVAWQRRQIERFRREAQCGRVMELRAHHYLFIERQEEVVRSARAFLLEEPPPAAAGGRACQVAERR